MTKAVFQIMKLKKTSVQEEDYVLCGVSVSSFASREPRSPRQLVANEKMLEDKS